LSIGLKAGPSYNIQNLLHEMSHFVEIDDSRTLKSGWGLKYGKWSDLPYYAGGGFYEFSSAEHIKREIKVWAYQYSLSQYLKLPEQLFRRAFSL
jgi:hypothetical protein